MPAFLTHFLFGQKVLETLADTRAALAAENEPDAFSWGLQGPDVLFFSKKASVKSAGRLLHEKNAGSFFFEGKRLLDGCSGWKKSVGESFLLGFLCHYYLDSRAHPFVFYFQAKNRGNSRKIIFPTAHFAWKARTSILCYTYGKRDRIKMPFAHRRLFPPIGNSFLSFPKFCPICLKNPFLWKSRLPTPPNLIGRRPRFTPCFWTGAAFFIRPCGLWKYSPGPALSQRVS